MGWNLPCCGRSGEVQEQPSDDSMDAGELREVLVELHNEIKRTPSRVETIGQSEETAAAAAMLDVADAVLGAAVEIPGVAPVFEILREIIHGVQAAGGAREELVDLLKVCRTICSVIFKAAQRVGKTEPITDELIATKRKMEEVRDFAQRFTNRGICMRINFAASTLEEIESFKQDLMERVELITVAMMLQRFQRLQPLPSMATVPSRTPEVPGNFIERSMAKTILAELTDAASSEPTSHCLWGLKGGGKSVLASWLVHHDDTRSRFNGGIFWVSLAGKAKEDRDLVVEELAPQIADVLGIQERDWIHEDADHEKVMKLLTAGRGDEKWLLVLDNVCDLELVETFARAGFHLLVTTTTTLGGSGSSDASTIKYTEVHEMEDEEAMSLLRATGGSASQLESAKKVAKECGMLPFALALARELASSAEEEDWEGILRDLQERKGQARVEALSPEGRIAFPVIDASYERLSSEDKENLQLAKVVTAHGTATSGMLRNLFGMPMGNARASVKRLVKSHMVHKMTKGGEGYCLHDLLLEYLRVFRVEEQDLQTSTQRQARFLAQLNVLDGYWNCDPSVGGGFYSLITSWESVMEFNRELDVKKLYATSLKNATMERAYREAAYLLKFLGHTDQATTMFCKALKIIEEEISQTSNPDAKIALLRKALAIIVANPGEESRSDRAEFYRQRLKSAHKEADLG